jgi:hypothetical protein
MPATHANVLCVKRLRDIAVEDAVQLLQRFGLSFCLVANGKEIPGSYWGEDEAGLIGSCLYARLDTPLHSILHEACHWITCSAAKRVSLHTDAADTQEEENATCYLQIILASYLTGFSQHQALCDMDTWGYSFRLGSASAWFVGDALAEQRWLVEHGLLDHNMQPTFAIRQTN